MQKTNSPLLLIGATFWILCTVLSSEILFRALDMSLAISLLAEYTNNQFRTTSTQKMWLERIKVFFTFAAAVLLILEIYYLFIA